MNTNANRFAVTQKLREHGVAPGFNPNVVREAVEHQYPFFPGISTPSELEQAMNYGCRVFKFFPAEAAGGAKLLTTIAAPYRHLGVEFIPTGGISLMNLANYLSIPDVIAVGGSWLGRAEDISAGRWQEIATAVQKTVGVVQGVRAQVKVEPTKRISKG